MKRKILSLLMLLLATGSIAMAQTSTFKTDFKEKRNVATFTTEAPLEDIVGTTRKVEAELMINPMNVSQSPKAMVKVDLAALTTGIDLRDDDMKGAKFLHTAKYPYATFTLTGISGASELKDATKTNVKLTGDLTIHGVTKKISVPATLTYFKQNEGTKSKLAGNLLKANAIFSIKMSDYGVKVPSMLMMKVSNDVKIMVDYVATDKGGNAAMNPCNPCGLKKDMKGKNPCNPKMDMKGKNPCNPKKENPYSPKKQY